MRKKCFVYVYIFNLVIGSLLLGKENIGDETGPLWKFHTEGSVRSTPVVSGKCIVVGSDSGYLLAVDTETGKEKSWICPFGGAAALGLIPNRWIPF